MSPQVNTTLPAKMLLLCWGPYALLYLSAAIMDVTSISLKLQMVQTPPGPRAATSFVSVSLCLAHLSFLLYYLKVVSLSRLL